MSTSISYLQDTQVTITRAQLAVWTLEGEPAGPLVATGPCPVCGDSTSQEIALDVVADAAAVEDLLPPEERTTRRFSCQCLAAHPNRPPTVLGGCGRWWLVTLTQDDNGWHLHAGGDSAMVPMLQALEEAAKSELVAVRSAAEKWLPGITVLYGLFGLAGIALGKDAVKALSFSSKLAVAVAVLLGLIATVIAVSSGYRAAFGWPADVDVSDDAKVRQWYLGRHSAVTASISNLRLAVQAAVAALGFLLVAVAVIWFGPTADPPSPKVKVAYSEGGDAARPASVCGKLVALGGGEGIAVEATDSTGSKTLKIDRGWVRSVTPTATCP